MAEKMCRSRRTEGDGRRIRATSSEAYIVAIIDEVEEPTAQKR